MPMPETRSLPRKGWLAAWPDLLAFAGGLSIAWFFKWNTTDLVWSLWLSSLVVGYASILWMATRPLREFVTNAAADPVAGMAGSKLVAGGVYLTGSLFVIAFFTVHFGGFHFVHSVFLADFFPVSKTAGKLWPGLQTYAEIFQRYWIFLPAAFIAERSGFSAAPKVKDDGAVTAEAIAARKARNAAKGGGMGDEMAAPYKNVIRMHLLIFFFAGVSMFKLDHFAVYAVVYAAYFFPWRLVRRQQAADSQH
jgi:hypothetical protein